MMMLFKITCDIYIYNILVGNKDIDVGSCGTEALRDGKGLFLSGHVSKVQYNGISANLSYCFIKGMVMRETSINASPYQTWVVLHQILAVLTALVLEGKYMVNLK